MSNDSSNGNVPVKRNRRAADKPTPDPAAGIRSAPPNFGQPAIPHIWSFQGISSTISRAYRNPDEAFRHSQANARFMRNDCAIMECLEARQRGTALLDWHLEVDGKGPAHEALKERLTRVLRKTRRFTEYRRWLQEALWFGRVGIQNIYGWDLKGGHRDLVIRNWLPINGDKLVFRMDDGTFQYPEGQVGIRVGAQYAIGQQFYGRKVEKVEPTESGMAIFLSPAERALLTVHKHMIEDAAYESPIDAGAIHGIGIRSRIYWTWFQKQETMALLMEYVERCGLGFEIWTYEQGNPESQAAVENAAKNRVGRRNLIFFPKPIGDDNNAYGVEHFEPSGSGVDSLLNLVTNYFGHLIKRYILGQILTSESDATGLGSGVADLHLQTFLDIVKYDAANHDETMTLEVVEPLKNQNDPKARNVDVRFVSQTQAPDTEQRLAALEKAWSMGARLKESEVLDMVGAAVPNATDRILVNPAVTQQGDPALGGAAAAAGVPTFEQQTEQLANALNIHQATPVEPNKALITKTANEASGEIDQAAAKLGAGPAHAADPFQAASDAIDETASQALAAFDQGQLRAVPDRYAQVHAPHNMTIAGKEYKGGQFIPNDELAKATPEQKKTIQRGIKIDNPKKEKAVRGELKPAQRADEKTTDAKGKPKSKPMLVYADGSKVPEHVPAGKIPAAWKNIRVSSNPDDDVWAVGTDEKGRTKTVYSDSYEMRQAAIKFARNYNLVKESDRVAGQIQTARQSDDAATREAAACMWLIQEQATRPGSEKDTGAKVKAYGATTLRAEHVVEAEDGVRLQFIGKEGVAHDHLIRNPALATELLRRKRETTSGKLFDTTDGKLLAFSKQLDHGRFTPKDFRTLKATTLATQEIAKLEKPANEKERKTLMMKVATIVSGVLGNRPQQAIESYINPMVWSAWA